MTYRRHVDRQTCAERSFQVALPLSWMVMDRGPARTRFLATSTPRPRIPDTRMSHRHSFLMASWPNTYLSQHYQTHTHTHTSPFVVFEKCASSDKPVLRTQWHCAVVNRDALGGGAVRDLYTKMTTNELVVLLQYVVKQII